MSGPLEGVLVVDAGWGMPSSVASMLFSDYGARVVKVERASGGLPPGSPERKAWDRGKWSIALDPREADDRRTLQELVRRADVFIESFGAHAEEYGFGVESTRALNELLVHISLTGYGREGPWAGDPGFDALVAARMGFMAEQPGHRSFPHYLGHPSIGYTTGLLAAIGGLAALRVRRVDGRGQRVDVSLLDGVLGQAPMNWWFTEKDESYLDTAEKGHFGHRRVLIDIYRCQDDRYLMIHSGGQGGFKAAMDVLGVGEHFREITDRVEMSVPLDDHEFEIARKVVPELWLQRPRDEWIRELEARDVAVVPLLRPGEILNHPQVLCADMAVTIPDHDHGAVRQAAPGVRFSRTPAGTPARAPLPDEHRNEVLGLLQASPLHGAPAPEQSLAHPLQGVRVLDFSQFMAAAYGAKYLSDLGAEVIKIEPPTGDPMRSLPDPFEACQRGKRSIVLDLATEEGRRRAHQLVATADVVVHNMRPGKADKIGIGYEALSKIRPDLIYCYQPGWGSEGPMAMRKSFAPLLSGITGLMHIAAGEGNPPVRRARASEDYYGGFLGAVGVLMALEHRERTGEGQYLECPQLHASLLAVSEHMLDRAGNTIPTRWRLDAAQRGVAPLYSLFPCTDGWLCVTAVGRRHHEALRRALALEAMAGGADDERETASVLEGRLEHLSMEEAHAWLTAHGVPCEPARPEPFMPDFFWQDWVIDSEHVFEHVGHPQWGYIREVGHTVRLSDTPGRRPSAGPILGEHTREILDELDGRAERG